MKRKRDPKKQATRPDAWASKQPDALPSPLGFAITRHRSILAVITLTLLLKSLIFEPIALWPLAFVCLVPWVIAIVASTHAARLYLYSYVFGLLFFLINMRWMYPATGMGYVALSVYLAVYFPFIACALRHAVRRRRWRLAVALPFVWVGCEMVRAVVVSGFPWFYLSHSLYRELMLIQVSDLAGAYAVSFLVAAINGAVADVAITYLGSRGTRSMVHALRASGWSLAFATLLLVATMGYGYFQLHRDTTSDGPKVAVIQGDFISLVNLDQAQGHDRVTGREKMNVYLDMLSEAAKEKPDLYVLPESPWPMFVSKDIRAMYRLSRDSFVALQRHATEYNAIIVTGCASRELDPFDLNAKERDYNSAAVYYPDGREPDRYDKIHLVYFGETVPFRFTRLHFLYTWLNSITPFSGPDGTREFSLFRGKEFLDFTVAPPSQPGKSYRFGIPICYEDVMPYVSREFVSGDPDVKRVDFLLNISNDGWFGRGIQQPQHLAISVFRAVENRVGIARAVNTGRSAFIQPSGRIHDSEMRDPGDRWPGIMGFSVANVGVDTRYTFYSRYGDWFAWFCAAIWFGLLVDYWVIRVRSHGEAHSPESKR